MSILNCDVTVRIGQFDADLIHMVERGNYVEIQFAVTIIVPKSR
jgi:hypothetical protein